MRILYSHRIQSRDGQSVHLDELVAALRALGHEVQVVGPPAYAAAGFGGESRGIARLRRLLPRAVAELAELAYNVPAHRRLASAAREFRPDFIYERYNLYHLAGVWLSRRRRIPLLLEVNSPLAAERARHGGLALRALADRAERWTWRNATRVLAVTRVLRDMIAARGVPADRVAVIPNAIVAERFELPPPPPRDGIVLGFVGFVRDWHGLDRVIDGMASDPSLDLRLTVVGDGPVRAELEVRAAGLGLADRVRFVGVVPNAEVPAHVAGFDIALQPRVVPYASPLKLFDYMAAGRAIVAPDQPNIREILVNGETAMLFDPAARGDMWAAITQLARDADLRARLGEAARAELARRDYTWRGNAARVAAIAAEVVRPR